MTENLHTKFEASQRLNLEKVKDEHIIKGKIKQRGIRRGQTTKLIGKLINGMPEANSFPTELKVLKNKFLGYKAGDGLITQLNLFLDEDGLIRVRGKLRSTVGLPNLKFPIFLHKNCTLTRVIIEELHRKIKHVGIYKLLHLLQKEFWVPCALQTNKKIVNKCLVCKKLNGRTIKLSQNC